MKPNQKFSKLATKKSITKTISSLEGNGIKTFVAENGSEARKKVLEIIPKNAQIMTMTSVTLEQLGLAKEINESGIFESIRKQLNSMNRETSGRQMQMLGAAPAWAIGSVHAVTEDGQVLVASATGSQLPAYAYGADNVVWVVGAQKIVKNIEDGMKRIYEYSLPFEEERARKAYGMGSGVNKILIVNKEKAPRRISIIFVNEKLGF